MATCTQCGAELKPGTKFCENCGAKVSVPQPAAQPAAVPPPPGAPPPPHANERKKRRKKALAGSAGCCDLAITAAGLIPPIQLWCVSYSVRRPSGQARYFLSPPTAITAR